LLGRWLGPIASTFGGWPSLFRGLLSAAPRSVEESHDLTVAG
jgi:hypothetical protein